MKKYAFKLNGLYYYGYAEDNYTPLYCENPKDAVLYTCKRSALVYFEKEFFPKGKVVEVTV